MQNLLRKLLLALLTIADSGGGGLCDCADSVDLIEINHFVNSSGETCLDQIIFWDFSPSQSRYIVRAWRSLKTPHQLPYLLPSGRFQTCWRDSRDSNALRIVSAGSVIETWTDYDPETVNQEYLDRNLRRELCPPAMRKRGGK